MVTVPITTCIIQKLIPLFNKIMETIGRIISIISLLLFLTALQSCSERKVECTKCISLDSDLKDIIYQYDKDVYCEFDYYISVRGSKQDVIVISKVVDPQKYPLFQLKDTIYKFDQYCYLSDKLIVLENLDDSKLTEVRGICDSEVTIISKKNKEGDFLETSFLDWIVVNRKDTIYVYEHIISKKSLIKSIVK